MMTKKERQELYNTNRPYYGYSMKEWASFKLKPVDDHDHAPPPPLPPPLN